MGCVFSCENACAVYAVCCVAQMCVGGLSGSTGRLKMLYPVSHKANKTASADEAILMLLFNNILALPLQNSLTVTHTTSMFIIIRPS